ncbi:diguanylate cyclase (GGDEF) domain-containing protein [Butyrivibrio sp. ob235]|uniref:GGDEF domain-containing response regulator n=1 Tax=Butyrivibrio sp. ob235 TaxID=1761780 RepID=UPI0008B24545|nr:diguanylate cyclase [Butyrivibrio sp. ob235]SEL35600.1 diguanylate cyclase (GGDEF) domain-containing protein [Butyrivibrio sp. ob235]
MDGRKILVVDDDEMIRMMTVRMLKSKYHVITASSGMEAIEIYEKEKPDMILSDLMMPGMSGFEMMQALREKYSYVIPVMFMTAFSGDDTESKGLEVGAVDYIRKPFKPDVLLYRIDNIMSNLDRIRGLEMAAEVEPMTGLLNKIATEREVDKAAAKGRGIFMMIDLDSFKLVNDLYGHEKGDKVLIWFAEMLRSIMRSNDVIGRIGGDEFAAFCLNTKEEKMVAERTQYMNRKIVSFAKELLGDDMNIPIGVSVGAVLCPDDGSDYQALYKKADRALYEVKQSGKHNYALYKHEENNGARKSPEAMAEINMLFKERNPARGAFVLSEDQFKVVYRFMMRFQKNYAWDVHFLCFKVEAENGDEEKLQKAADHFLEVAASSLRGSDVLTRYGNDKVLAIFLKVTEPDCEVPINRIEAKWREDPEAAGYTVSVLKEYMVPD